MYTAVEQYDATFLEREFDSTSGTLYKSDGGLGAELALLSEDQEYTGLVEKHGSRDEDKIRNMTEVLNNGEAASYSEVLIVDSALNEPTGVSLASRPLLSFWLLKRI